MDSILVPPPFNSAPLGTARPATTATGNSRSLMVVGLRRLLLPPVLRLRLMLLTGFLGTLIVVATAPVRREAVASWRLTLPLVPHPGHALFSAASFIVGMTMLSVAWIRLGAFTTDRSQTTRRRLCVVLAAGALWTAPILLGPPLLSNDVYSYAAQGELASRGVDPTVVGPNALGGGPFMRAADPIWWNNPAPYGPAWNKIAETVVVATDHDAALSVWALRGVVLVAVIIAAFALYDLTRARNPALALTMGIVNPVVLIHLVGGIHNDAVMVALMMVALACARRSWFLTSIVFMTLATAVKLPAAAGLVYLGWHAPYVRAQAQRFVTSALALFFGLVSSVVLSFAWGMSLGWVSALKGTGKVMSTFAPTTMLGLSLSDAFSLVGIEVDPDHAVAMSRLVGLLGAGLIALWLLRRSERSTMERALGLSMALAVLFGPVLWPWYAAMAFTVLAASDVTRVRSACVVWTVAISLFVFPTSVGTQLGLAQFQAWLGIALLVGLTVLSSVAQGITGDPIAPAPVLRAIRVRGDKVALDDVDLARV
ncbi:MAG TPA: polyprenol phosphomannose-dependent alpha 1,6 mannosyltransferase MptB [Acidimicrobiales bacterium]|nr:polyprenol phosphomannose-dependent alpha 1,6 mannosyltransferase MptB [Acidimicrobiales bacterium]